LIATSVDLFQDAQKLTHAAQDIAQATAKQFNASVEAVKLSAAELNVQIEALTHQFSQLVQQGLDALDLCHSSHRAGAPRPIMRLPSVGRALTRD